MKSNNYKLVERKRKQRNRWVLNKFEQSPEPSRSTFFWKEIELQEKFLKFEETVQIYIPGSTFSQCHATLRLRERHRQRQTKKRDTNRNRRSKISITPCHTSPSRSTVGRLWYLHDVRGLIASLHTKSSFPLLFFSAFKLCLHVLKTGVSRTNVTPRRI